MRIVDLSHVIFPGMFKFPGDYHPAVEFEVTGVYDRDRCLVHRVIMGTHSGTHIDAPRHFFEGYRSIDEVLLDMLITEVYVVDLTGVMEITREAFAKHEEELKKVGGVLLRTGWWRYWGTSKFYSDFPLMTADAARWLVERGLKTIAVDFPLPGEVHEVVLGSDGVLIENLTNLDRLPVGVIKLIALPLKLKGLDAAPARVVALVED